MKIELRILGGMIVLSSIIPPALGQSSSVKIGRGTTDVEAVSSSSGKQPKNSLKDDSLARLIADRQRGPGHKDFDPAAVAADKAKKEAALSKAKNDKASSLSSTANECVVKPVMSNAELERCRSRN
jgi:hypothetical protein